MIYTQHDIYARMSALLDDLEISVKDKVKLEIILEKICEENINEGSIYTLISEKLDENPSTIKKLLTRVIKEISEEKLKSVLDFEEKPSNKEFLVRIYEKIGCGKEKQELGNNS
jgi:hypothetical protein